jgi:hypothetical protein
MLFTLTKKSKTIVARVSDEQRSKIDEEVKRLEASTRLKVHDSDVIRRALDLYFSLPESERDKPPTKQ